MCAPWRTLYGPYLNELMRRPYRAVEGGAGGVGIVEPVADLLVIVFALVSGKSSFKVVKT